MNNYKFIFTLLAFLILNSVTSFAQYTTVKFDPSSNWFNQGQALPAEEDMVFTGPASTEHEMIELRFLDPKKEDLLFSAVWRRQNQEQEFIIPVNYKLRADHAYTLQFDYYGSISKQEQQELKQQLLSNLFTTVEVAQKESKGFDFRGNGRKIINNMNELLEEQLAPYRAKIASWTPALSDLVKLQIEQMQAMDLDANYNRSDTTQTRQSVRNSARTAQLERLQTLLNTEVERILDVPLFKIRDSRIVKNYATEGKKGALSLNLGYGGVYLSGKWTNGQYAAAPYAGVAIPLGNRVLGTKFFRNTAINAGVFLTTLEGAEGQVTEGFLIKQPLYLGLDYRLFQFVHFNAGTAILNGNTLSGNDANASDQQLAFRPFVGLSARINLQMGLGK